MDLAVLVFLRDWQKLFDGPAHLAHFSFGCGEVKPRLYPNRGIVHDAPQVVYRRLPAPLLDVRVAQFVLSNRRSGGQFQCPLEFLFRLGPLAVRPAHRSQTQV